MKFLLFFLIFFLTFGVFNAYSEEHEIDGSDNKNEKQDFAQSVILVLAPIIVGAILTNFLTKTWQDHKHKISIKDEILNAFQDSGWRIHNLQVSFMLRVVRKYVDNSPLELLEDSEVKEDKVNFPSEESEQPTMVFLSDYKKLEVDIDETRYKSHVFVSKMRLYLDDESLFTTYQKIRDLARVLSNIIIKTIKSKSTTEFANNVNEFRNKRAEIRKLLAQFEKNLVDSKIRKIPV